MYESSMGRVGRKFLNETLFNGISWHLLTKQIYMNYIVQLWDCLSNVKFAEKRGEAGTGKVPYGFAPVFSANIFAHIHETVDLASWHLCLQQEIVTI